MTTSSAAIIHLQSKCQYDWIEMCGSAQTYRDVTAPRVEYAARYAYAQTSSTCTWQIGASTRMPLITTACTSDSCVQSNAQKQNSNGKPIVIQLNDINRLEPDEYGNIQNLKYNYTPDAPQSECGV